MKNIRPAFLGGGVGRQARARRSIRGLAIGSWRSVPGPGRRRCGSRRGSPGRRVEVDGEMIGCAGARVPAERHARRTRTSSNSIPATLGGGRPFALPATCLTTSPPLFFSRSSMRIGGGRPRRRDPDGSARSGGAGLPPSRAPEDYGELGDSGAVARRHPPGAGAPAGAFRPAPKGPLVRHVACISGPRRWALQ